MRALLCCGVLSILLGLGVGRSDAADARASFCPNPWLAPSIGRGDLLGVYAEVSLVCEPRRAWNLQTGLRYAEYRGTTEPFIVLTYQRAVTPAWALTMSASRRERVGDYEIDRLPELSIRWSPATPRPTWLISILDLSVGSIAVGRPQAQTSRLGAALGLVVLPIALRPRVELRPSLRLATYRYGTNESHTYWIGTVDLSHRASPRVEVGMVFNHQEGYGVSPLAYDAVNFEETIAGRIVWWATPATTVFLAATYRLNEPALVKEYVLSFQRSSRWTGWLIWRQLDNQVLFSVSMP